MRNYFIDRLLESFSDTLSVSQINDIADYMDSVIECDDEDIIEEIYIELAERQGSGNPNLLHIVFVVSPDTVDYPEELKDEVYQAWDMELSGIDIDASLELNMAEKGTGTIIWQKGAAL